MSVNLLAGVEPTLVQSASMPNPVSMENGVITSGVWKDVWYDIATWTVSLDSVTENQTVHIGLSVKWHDAAATTGSAWASVRYADAAGNINNADSAIDGITTEWQRFSLSMVVPSGMRLTDLHISAKQLDAAYDATAPCMSYGSPVALASSAHTPYATDGHLQAVYATQAQLAGYIPISGGTLTGNVTAPKFKGPLEGNVTGNASTASRLSTARTIAISGAVTGSAMFDGSGNVNISTTANESYISSPISGLYNMGVDADGNLWVYHSDSDKAPNFEYDSSTGNLYYVTEA